MKRTVHFDKAEVALASADVSVGGGFTEGGLTPGDPVEFTVDVANSGPHAARDTAVEVRVPEGVKDAKVSSGADCSAPAGGVVSCDVGTLDKGGKASVKVTGTVAEDVEDAYALTASADATTSTDDVDPANNFRSFDARVDHRADLALSVEAPAAGVEPGDEVVYTVTVDNEGPSRAEGVEVTDELPEGMLVKSARTESGTFDTATGKWLVGSVGSGKSAVLTVTGVVPADRDTLVHTATISASATPDPEPGNNRVSTETKVAQKASLKAVLTADKKDVKPGDEVVYTVTVDNEGPSRAEGVEVTDELPEGMLVKSARTESGTFDTATGKWLVGSVGSGKSAVLTLTGVVPADRDTLVHTATITASATRDPRGEPGKVPAHRASTELAVTQQADLQVSLTPASATVPQGEESSLTVSVINEGPSTARDARATLTLPDHLKDVTDDSDGAFDTNSGRWSTGDLPPGGKKDLTVTYRPATEDDLVFEVSELASDTTDPTPCHDVCASTTVNVTSTPDPTPTDPEPTPTTPTPDP
ncbi:DUF11 domain-containing protein, partial [Streptomyces wuyuanensis]|uniref:DUF11 domain-containing protein n=1 Tax=Streptomyces wuyuanensis TaxID=1196353 RepID=UPI00341FBDED